MRFAKVPLGGDFSWNLLLSTASAVSQCILALDVMDSATTCCGTFNLNIFTILNLVKWGCSDPIAFSIPAIASVLYTTIELWPLGQEASDWTMALQSPMIVPWEGGDLTTMREISIFCEERWQNSDSTPKTPKWATRRCIHHSTCLALPVFTFVSIPKSLITCCNSSSDLSSSSNPSVLLTVFRVGKPVYAWYNA